MNTHPKVRSMVAAVVALSLVGSGSALAGHRYDSHDYGSRYGGHHDKHRGYDRHDRHHYKGSRHDRHRGRYAANYYRHDDDDGDEKLLIGLLLGGLVGYAILNSASNNTYEDNSYPQANTRPEVEPAIYAPHRSSAASSCLQEREYQSTVIVGGREVDAYGTACLQPDGSWSRGPLKLAAF